MTADYLVKCRQCGILNHSSSRSCLLCRTRLDRPVDFSDKEENFRYFRRGGLSEIAMAAAKGELADDTGDVAYTSMVNTAMKLALEASWKTMDVVFYRRNPVHGVPTLGVRWPDSPLLTGLELSFLVGGKEVLFASMVRPGAEVRGTNYRWDDEFADEKFEYQLMLCGVSRKVRGRTELVKTDPISMVPNTTESAEAPYSLVRPLSGLRVK